MWRGRWGGGGTETEPRRSQDQQAECDGTIKRQTAVFVSARFTSPPLALLEEAQRREEVQPVQVVVDSGLQQVVL